MALAAISVDLDSLQHYCRIHGLDESLLDERAKTVVYSQAVSRFREVLADAPATLFAIGEDLSLPGAAEVLRAASQAGWEIGSHSHRHDYALSRRTKEEISRDLAEADAAIEQAVGMRPVGFRAPGYTVSPALLQSVCERGYLYDSSAFPSVPYYLGKAAVMGALALSRRPSKSILDTPRVLAAPRDPYRPDPANPYRRGSASLLELPITTAPLTRFPFIGTFALTLPEPLIRAQYKLLRGVQLFNFELHGIDLLDATDVPSALVGRQRDLSVRAVEKRERLREIVSWLRSDFELVTLADAAQRLSAR
jgi:peptidoglycan-N-acetylglucosamine deacetylase